MPIDYKTQDWRIQNNITLPLDEDSGILILSQHSESAIFNQGMFLDTKSNEMKISKFHSQVGNIHHWHGACSKYKKYTAFLTDELQILRFDNQTYDWSLQELAEVKWNVRPEKSAFQKEENDSKKEKKKIKKQMKREKKMREKLQRK